MLMQNSGFDSYQSVDLDAQAASANPHQLVIMLIDGLLDEVVRVKGHIESRRLEAKGKGISKCMNILIGLDSALDVEAGGELAANLHDLYEFCISELFKASSQNKVEHLETVENVMTNVREGWEGFGQHA
ncbi:flagellar export chaperone FliS [Photobacterium halotolerans]|uniref:flagellar export chaperone FliS n=1 Tax=Photobacterium halotolerans TaxID=265726 RepID=UPI0004838831|nr:flagellar export chaperone FliS [Photobacterium halotolerans]